jgi:hypothetical protein
MTMTHVTLILSLHTSKANIQSDAAQFSGNGIKSSLYEISAGIFAMTAQQIAPSSNCKLPSLNVAPSPFYCWFVSVVLIREYIESHSVFFFSLRAELYCVRQDAKI